MKLNELKARAARNPKHVATVLWRRPGAVDQARTMLSLCRSIEDAGRLARGDYSNDLWRLQYRPAAVALRTESGVEVTQI